MNADNVRISMLCDIYGALLSDKEREALTLYYDEDLSLAEIADNIGITRQGVRDSIKRAEAQLLEMEERLGLARRFREMKQQLEAVSRNAHEIRELNDRWNRSHEIDELAAGIEETARRLANE